MLKVIIDSVDVLPATKSEFYSLLNPIPFSIMIGEFPFFPETTYCRNLHGRDFIEFRFDQETSKLFEIEMVDLNPDSVKELSNPELIRADQSQYYSCKINEAESGKEDSLGVQIFRGNTSVYVLFDNEDLSAINLYQVGRNVYVGVNKENYLKAVYINEIAPKDVNEIFGF